MSLILARLPSPSYDSYMVLAVDPQGNLYYDYPGYSYDLWWLIESGPPSQKCKDGICYMDLSASNVRYDILNSTRLSKSNLRKEPLGSCGIDTARFRIQSYYRPYVLYYDDLNDQITTKRVGEPNIFDVACFGNSISIGDRLIWPYYIPATEN